MSTAVRDLLEKLSPASAEGGERVPERLIWLLGIGVIGLTWSMTTVASYLPPVLGRHAHSRVVIGAILAGEGAVAIIVPLLIGPLSDRTRTRFGRRRPYMLAAVPVMVATLATVTLPADLWLIAAVLAGFFIAYYVYYTPYRSLYPDLLPREVEGRAQSVQHVFRGAALGGALVLGGVLLGIWRGLPFLVSAGIVVAAGLAGVMLVHERNGEREDGRAHGLAPLRIVRKSREVRWFLIANSGWETTFAGMRTFVVLYVVKGLNQPYYVSSAVLATVAAGYLVAAVGAGRLGDRLGTGRVIFVAAAVYGGGLVVGVFPTSWQWFYLGYVFLIAIAAGAVMTLAWGLLFKVMPEDDRGASAGLGSMTKGVGLIAGPIGTGIAIDLASRVLSSTDGYAVMWPVLAVPVLLTLPFVRLLRRSEQSSEKQP